MNESSIACGEAMAVPDAMGERIRNQILERKTAFEDYASLLLSFNRLGNLISKRAGREDAVRHIEHCAAVCMRRFPAGSLVVDWGTGGGLPAIVLALIQPDVQVVAVDAVGKKCRAVEAMASRLGLKNIEAWHGRAEDWTGNCEFSVSRATATLDRLWTWHTRVSRSKPDEIEPGISGAGDHADDDSFWAPGLVCLKGGDLRSEIDGLLNRPRASGQAANSSGGAGPPEAPHPAPRVDLYDLAPVLGRTYFDGKMLVHVHR